MRASDAQQICPGQDHQLVDLWNDAQPGLGLNNTASCQLPKQGSLPYPVGADGRASRNSWNTTAICARVRATLRADRG